MKKIIILLLIIESLFSIEIPKNIEKDIFKQMEVYDKMYTGNDFISKKDFTNIKEEIKTLSKENKGPYSFLLYFTSTSVPKETMLNVLFSLSILQENGIKMYSKQYLIGFPEDLQGYVKEVDTLITENYKNKRENMIRENFGLKIDPRYFETFSLKKAPAMALFTCPSIIPDIENCKVHYLMKGDISLYTFFDTIAKEDKRYEKLTKILIANKIVNKEGK